MRKILLGFLVLSTGLLFAINADDIVKKVDANQTFTTYKGSGKVIIEGKYGKRISEYEVYAKGSDNTMIEFLSGEEEGQKIFKTPDDLYIKYPYAEEIQRLSRKKTLGAVSYDEMSGEKNTLDNYTARLLEDTNVNGHEVYQIELIAKTSKVSNYKQVLYVDKGNFSVWKVNYYSKSGKLTKDMLVNSMEELGGKFMATNSIITDRLKKHNSTENVVTSMEIDIPLDDSLFSLDELAW